MRFYFDTSILLPALIGAHPNHLLAKSLFNKSIKAGEIVCLNLHVYAELYANLTRFRQTKKIPPNVAARALKDLSKVVTTIGLDEIDYQLAIDRCARLKLVSGVIYDALHVQAAIKADVDTLYTMNLRDFTRLADDVSFDIKGLH